VTLQNLGMQLWNQNERKCWILEDISLHCYFIADIHFTFHNFFIFCNAHSRFRGNIMFLFMYSDCTNTVDPHMIIIIFLFFSVFYIFLMDRFVFSVFDSRY
jgi:hypothetical protein